MAARAVFGLALLSACMIAARAPVPGRTTIDVRQFAFAPPELTASVGDTIEWINRDDFVHTTHADSGAWSSPELRRSEAFVFVPRRTGRFAYHCRAHPTMRGVLVVND